MPVQPTYPGVYIEEIPSGVRTITGVATSIAAFVGWSSKGPTDRAELVLSWSDFERNVDNHYRTGDYWLIPARVATKDIEWPRDKDEHGKEVPAAKPPHGIRHHYAPLAILTTSASEGGWKVEDCRCEFTALNKCTIPSHGEDGMGGAPICSKPRASSLKRESHIQRKPRAK